MENGSCNQSLENMFPFQFHQTKTTNNCNKHTQSLEEDCWALQHYIMVLFENGNLILFTWFIYKKIIFIKLYLTNKLCSIFRSFALWTPLQAAVCLELTILYSIVYMMLLCCKYKLTEEIQIKIFWYVALCSLVGYY